MNNKRKINSINSKRRFLYLTILFLLLFIGVGYSYLSSSLAINGHTELAANTWNIHFENLKVADGSSTASVPAAINSNQTIINYSVTLNNVGDYYEFSVDVVNSGSLMGKVSLANINGVSNYGNNVQSSIKYLNGDNVTSGDLIPPNSSKRIIVRVEALGSSLPLDLSFEMEFDLGDGENNIVSNLLENLALENSCIVKYEGNVTDQVEVTSAASRVYFDKCTDKRNILFAGMCWQVIRSTENGGLKVIYNGDAVDGKCELDRQNILGIRSPNGYVDNVQGEKLFGNGYTYDSNTGTFNLVDTFISSWSDSTYGNIIGKYTCVNDTGTCNNLYSVNGYKSNEKGFINNYEMTDMDYTQIGSVPFNVDDTTPALAGYMFNKEYEVMTVKPGTTEYKFGNSFTYDENTGLYELAGEIKTVDDWENEFQTLYNTHYSCFDMTGECSSIAYIFYTNETDATFIILSNGESVSDALNTMLYDDNVNRFDSNAKMIVDNWYREKLLSYTSKLESPVYCGDRTIIDYSGWDPNTSNYNSDMLFNNSSVVTNLECTNVTDQYSLYNNKAKLKYPVALLTAAEINILNSNSLLGTGSVWWTMSPFAFCNHRNPGNVIIVGDGSRNDEHVGTSFGLRPVITLSSSSVILGGNGSESNPWIIE